jgi:hypothetical protein
MAKNGKQKIVIGEQVSGVGNYETKSDKLEVKPIKPT